MVVQWLKIGAVPAGPQVLSLLRELKILQAVQHDQRKKKRKKYIFFFNKILRIRVCHYFYTKFTFIG